MATPNFENRTLFHGDNLKFLRGMNSETIDLIATDPPFNKGRDFHATPDSLAKGAKFQDRWSWAEDVEQEWVDQIEDDWPNVATVIGAARKSWGDDLGAFLCFMGVRLAEMHRVLKDTGSIYLHCDPTASHYLKALMDAVFGRENFQNEIIWRYRRWPSKQARFQRMHDVILFYRKDASTEQVFNQPYEELAASTRETWGTKQQVADFSSGRRKPSQTDRESPGAPMSDVWNIGIIAPIAKERTGYPTQKPLALYERIIRASSNEDDWVLDPFAGCATTPVAAERLGRRWIGMDLWDGAHPVTVDRLRAERRLFTLEEVRFVTEPPERTDDGEEAVPFLQVTERYSEPQDGPKMSRKEMLEFLLAQHGPKCQGCDREFDDPRYLQLDHNTPRSDGGWNHISNRVLLCGPCNQLKSNVYTLSGLRRENAKHGYMAGVRATD